MEGVPMVEGQEGFTRGGPGLAREGTSCDQEDNSQPTQHLVTPMEQAVVYKEFRGQVGTTKKGKRLQSCNLLSTAFRQLIQCERLFWSPLQRTKVE